MIWTHKTIEGELFLRKSQLYAWFFLGKSAATRRKLFSHAPYMQQKFASAGDLSWDFHLLVKDLLVMSAVDSSFMKLSQNFLELCELYENDQFFDFFDVLIAYLLYFFP